MGAVFIKQLDDSHELIDKETGEITELYETYKIDEELWFKLYINTFFEAICEITSVTEIKLFALCLKFAREQVGYGNVINTSDFPFKVQVEKRLKLNRQNLCRAIKSLCEKGFLHKIAKSNYRINPQITYCGDKHNRAKLILKLIKE